MLTQTNALLKFRMEDKMLSELDIEEIQSPYDFQRKYDYGKKTHDEASGIEGKYYWISRLASSRGLHTQRNQEPVQVVVVIGSKGEPIFHKVSSNGKTLKGKISLYDNAGNGLHICETEYQAAYMYNIDIEKAMSEFDSKIEDIEIAKSRLATQEQDLN